MIRYWTRRNEVTSLAKAFIMQSRTYAIKEINFKELDEKWTKNWQNNKYLRATPTTTGTNSNVAFSDKAKCFYLLVMFPYPSGILHMGHLRVYTIGDVVARFKKMQGYKVINPMGWDAFGLPAENAAVERGIDPAIWTETNIAVMKDQMKCFLADFDWHREINTCSPEYYKWTQKIFLMMFENGLAYQKEAEINWDPVDKTVLANEQVDSEGKSWRSGAIVEKRNLKQWFIGITKYAERLVQDLDTLTGWPQNVKTMQKNWIGKSRGLSISFPISNSGNPLRVYTTRPDTLFSVQFLALSLNHALVVELAKNDIKLAEFINHAKTLDSDSKQGYKLENLTASIPINSDNSKREIFDVPIYVAPYVLSEYGSGAVMGCPGHDLRDYEFWKLHEPNGKIIQVIGTDSKEQQPSEEEENITIPYVSKQGVLRSSNPHVASLGDYEGKSPADAAREITTRLNELGLGEEVTHYKLKDWLISRQRYWGAPIPIVHCEKCGPVGVPEEQLPVLLPKVDSKYFGKGNPLENAHDFVHCKCPSCGGSAKRETDTMDTFMDSSWYFLRYLDPHNNKMILSKEASQNMPVDLYIGGVEHAILHLMYTRFVAKFLKDQGIWGEEKGEEGIKSSGGDEPMLRLITQGMVHGKTFSDPSNGKFLKQEELNWNDSETPVIKGSGKTPVITYEKMSKSKFNGVDPGECILKHGADATRAHIIFSAPVSDTLQWNEEQISGIDRWLRRVINLADSVYELDDANFSQGSVHAASVRLWGGVNEHNESKTIELNEHEFELYNSVQGLIQNIANSIDEVFSLNTVVSDLMKITNLITEAIKKSNYYKAELIQNIYRKLLVCMAPVTPVTAEECWEKVNIKEGREPSSVLQQSYPREELLQTCIQRYNVFIDGKARGTIVFDKNLVQQSDANIVDMMRKNPNFERYLSSSIQKVIKKNGLISIVSAR
ncbi:NAM2 [Candida oxycetoniae]|uniref:leucine--tRNA ligase n=1 Tax=Candida oxycetoniae TaxID=497107 RepID=A0AAI9SV70_9ASCO|nr:NAM2 [Candida oxycetoniae]KAI3403104.2 NAM2 [Candida oxycetoniae]